MYNSTGPGHLPNACHVAHQQTANPAVCWRADDEHLRRDGAAWVRINALAFGAERRFDYRAVRDGTTGVAKSMKLRAGDLRKVTGGCRLATSTGPPQCRRRRQAAARASGSLGSGLGTTCCACFSDTADQCVEYGGGIHGETLRLFAF